MHALKHVNVRNVYPREQRQKIKKKASKATVGQTVVTTMENEAGKALG